MRLPQHDIIFMLAAIVCATLLVFILWVRTDTYIKGFNAAKRACERGAITCGGNYGNR